MSIECQKCGEEFIVLSDDELESGCPTCRRVFEGEED